MPRKLSQIISIIVISISVNFVIPNNYLAAHDILINLETMKKGENMSDSKKRNDQIEENYKSSPEYYREKYKSYIFDGKIVKGMWPTEALLAGGGGTYRVKADKNVWPENSDPIRVMQSQSINQDGSEITIQFCNKSQFSSDEDVIFEVIFKMGIAEYINVKNNSH
jgi:hypothetical protein